jgi:hypothetical protein
MVLVAVAVNMTSDFWLGETKESWVPTRHSLNVMLYIAPSNLQHALPMAHVREHISRWWKQFTNHEPRRGKSTVESNQYLLSPTGKKGFDVIVATVFDVFSKLHLSFRNKSSKLVSSVQCE